MATVGEQRVAPKVPADWRTSSILVVDDHASNVALLTGILRKAGMTKITGLTDPRLAAQTFAEIQPDLVLLDLHMPFMDGFEVLATLSRLTGAHDFVPIVILTADITQATREQALSAGAKDFLTKPFNNAEVLLRVINLLESRALYRALRVHNAALAQDLRVYDARDRRHTDEFNEQVARVTEVLVPGAIRTVFQPIVHLESGTTTGLEALSRFSVQPERSPDRWFADATQVGLGTELELEAIAVIVQHFDDVQDDLWVSVNVSPEALLDPRVPRLLGRLPAERIVIEITEHTRVESYEALNEVLAPLRARGMRVAVDDAGAGFAGLQQILHIRPEVIKLDIALTHGIDADPIRRALTSSLLSFANEIGAVIVAEGVETAEELDMLRKLGVLFGQGFALGRPEPIPCHHVQGRRAVAG